jgi:replication-associated recombination protein RarA
VSGFIEIASGDQNADAVRDIARSMRLRPMVGDWRVIVVNEADRMTAAGEVCWLDILEKLPAKCVVIFTTNNPDKLTQRFRDRCRSLEFVADARSVREFVRKEWSRRMGDAPIPADLSAAGCLNGSPSYRAALQEIEIAIECADLDLSGPPRLIVHTSDRVWGVFSADEQSDAERMQSALAKEMPGFNFYLSESRTECAPGQVPPADCAALVA